VIRAARRPVREGVRAYCDLVDVVRDRVRFWSVLAEDQGRNLDADLPEGAVPVRSSAEDVAAAVDALLGNVFAHTSDGVGLRVRVEQRPGGGGRLTVEDDGPGFPDLDVMERGRSVGGSTGLGLDIVRRTAEASGGRVTVGAAAGGGALVLAEFGPPA
jgi:signal transduction histidine kinase